VTTGCSVVQNGASSACLNRLSPRVRSQLSSPALSSGHPLSMCSTNLQTVCSAKAWVQGSRKCAVCSMTCAAHACRTCTGWPAISKECTRSRACGVEMGVCVVETVLHCSPTECPYLCRKLVQANGPWPTRCTGGGRARPHHALRRKALEELQAARILCGQTTCHLLQAENSAAELPVCLWGCTSSLGWSATHGLLRRALLRAPPVLDVQAVRSVGAFCCF